jgi:hypothetical protein
VTIVVVVTIMVVVIVPAVVVAIVIMVPVMVMVETAAVAVPVAYVVLAAFVARRDPAGSLVRRTRPVSPMPSVVPSLGIPISIHPYKIRPRTSRKHVNHARRWRLPDSDPHGNLTCERDRARQQKCGEQQASAQN